MDPHKLKMWRKRHKLTQEQAAARLAMTPRQWRRYEQGATPTPQSVADHCAAHPEPNGEDPRPALDPATLTRAAVELAEEYIAGMNGMAAKFGKNTPWKWAASYWYEGALRAPYVYYGSSGHTPCLDALRAALSLLERFEQAGGVWRTLATLDDCPASIRAAAQP